MADEIPSALYLGSSSRFVRMVRERERERERERVNVIKRKAVVALGAYYLMLQCDQIWRNFAT